VAVKILVVDDEPDLEALITQKFRRRIRGGELSFAFAHDGEEALSVLKADPDIGVVLTDIRMPHMDGLTLLTHIKGLSRLLRAVVVSAYGDMDNIRTAMNRGAYDFVTKPIDFSDLEKTIDKTVEDIATIREVNKQRLLAEQARSALAHYISPNLAQHLAKHPDTVNLGGERRELSFVLTDMTDYTPFIESSDPSTAVKLMNEYIGGMCNIVLAHEGTIDTVVGDAVIAMFGAPVVQTDHASQALACALELDAFAVDFTCKKNAQGIPIGNTRIGVHTGSVIVGNFGGEVYFHYTAQGDTINTAARLESANKYLGTRICVSADTVQKIPDFIGRPVGILMLKGKQKGIKAFEPLGETGQDMLEKYMAAYEKMESMNPAAVQSFATLVAEAGTDSLAKFHLQRLLTGQQGATILLTQK